MSQTPKKKTYALIILDGWGHRESPDHNAIYHANTPVWDDLIKHYPHTLISGSGEDVGLPDKQMGNSEVGHMNLGAGRIIYQDLTRINQSLRTGEFTQNPVVTELFTHITQTQTALHLFGLVSAGGVHAHEDHILQVIKLAAQKGVQKLYVHAFLDGRDTPPQSARETLKKFEALYQELQIGQIISVSGRYYAMDRDKRWERVQPVYEMLTEGKASYQAKDSLSALDAIYDRGETDEFAKPTIIIREEGHHPITIQDGDSILFMNFRSDRARQITECFVNESFDGFPRHKIPALKYFITLTQYAERLKTSAIFKPASLKNGLTEVLANQGKTQLKIAETEKYAHVTFFFNGGKEDCYEGEERILIPSPKVATYDLKPEMSAFEVTDAIINAIESNHYDCIVVNFANGDMVGHTGKFDAAVKAVESLDICLGKIIPTLLAHDGECLITADHGNVEQMIDYDANQPHTQHTCELVPLVFVSKRQAEFVGQGILSDVAPTLLAIMGVTPPIEMTGKALLKGL